jgi:DME family drug/metabolite transporter
MRQSAVRARLEIILAAALFSTGGAGIKLCSLSSWQVAGLRSAAAALVLALMRPAPTRRWSWRALAVGAAYASTMILFVLGNKLTTAANTIFLQSTAPLYVVAVSPWLLHEPIRRRDLLFMTALAAGLSLFFVGIVPPAASAPDPLRGNVVAALSGVTWAATILGLRWMASSGGNRTSINSALVTGNLITVLVCVPIGLPLASIGTTDWLIVAYLGFIQVGLAYVCLSKGVRHVPALEASLLLLVEPVLNPIWAWIVQGERPGPWSLAGGAVILLATAIKTWSDAPARAQPRL